MNSNDLASKRLEFIGLFKIEIIEIRTRGKNSHQSRHEYKVVRMQL